MQITDHGNIPLLVGEDQHVVLSVDAIVSDRSAVVGVEALLVLERDAVSPLQSDILEHIHLIELIFAGVVVPRMLVRVEALLLLQLSEFPREEVHRGVAKLVEVLSLQDHLLEEFSVFHVPLELWLLEVEQATGVEIRGNAAEAMLAEVLCQEVGGSRSNTLAGHKNWLGSKPDGCR